MTETYDFEKVVPDDAPALPLVMRAPRRGKPPEHWSDLDAATRRQRVVEAGLPAFRAQQLSRHWYERLDDDPTGWTDLPASVREAVASQFFPRLLHPVRTLGCDDGATVKSLWRLHDGALVESVLMRYGVGRPGTRSTICISSQAGCGMACPFCATGQGGLQRNMSTAEIVEQVVAGARTLARGEAAGGPGRISNVVFMGMGEPMANYASVMQAIRTITAPEPDGLGISARGVTLSTVGLVPRIQQLTEEGIPLTLAVSLHAPDDELRDTLVPINTRHKVDEVVDAAWEYARVSRRRVSIEYALIKDINDQAWRADRLATVLKRRGDWGWVHVNLIPLNPIKREPKVNEVVYTRSREEDMAEFVRRLQARGISTTMRDTRGNDIDAACGQLAAEE